MKILNLQFNDHVIKYAVTKKNNPNKVYSYGSIELEDGMIIKGKISNFQALYRLLRKEIKRLKLNQGSVNLVFSDMQLFKKRLIIPKVINPSNFRQFIDANLHSSILMPVEDPIYFYERLKRDDEKNHHVMMFALSNQSYSDYQRLMFELKKKINDFTFESLGIIHFENFIGNAKRYKNKSTLLVDISEDKLNLTIFDNYTIVYSVIADLDTKKIELESLDDVYDRKSILYKIYFEVEKVVNFYNVSVGIPLDVVFKSIYNLPIGYLKVCAESLETPISRIENTKVREAKTKKIITEEKLFKLIGVANKARQKEAVLKFRLSKIKTYGFRMYGALIASFIFASLLVITSTNFINTYFGYQREQTRLRVTENELEKLTDINTRIEEFNIFEEIISVVYNVNNLEINVNYLTDRIASLRTEESTISRFGFNAQNEVSFTYTDTDTEVMEFIERLRDEEWALQVSYKELFFTEDGTEVSVFVLVDRSKITFMALEGSDKDESH